jgi:hypothetical protein
MAGAEGFEPSPSTLTVWCPTSWTTPQLCLAAKAAASNGVGSAVEGAAEGSLKITRQGLSRTIDGKYVD